jgi:hypothetical protein
MRSFPTLHPSSHFVNTFSSANFPFERFHNSYAFRFIFIFRAFSFFFSRSWARLFRRRCYSACVACVWANSPSISDFLFQRGWGGFANCVIPFASWSTFSVFLSVCLPRGSSHVHRAYRRHPSPPVPMPHRPTGEASVACCRSFEGTFTQPRASARRALCFPSAAWASNALDTL